ncbi:MAG TPA: PRC-barrel domain protein [Euryarchaeota archaeon]|nr:MAG: PRC-barrel domain protein [Thermoplasmatales archaeon ex4484_6]RLF69073.1 MAG: PRC-barrel domain protein [Thermoplasmata archaeon]HHD15208.1 PRC-barrel domain protein [Euryarchaeota archaeon]
MRFFVNDIQEKFVMSSDGNYLGQVDNLVVDTKSGKVLHLLVIPSEEVDIRKFRMDSQQRLVLPFDKVKSIKDVVIMSSLD